MLCHLVDVVVADRAGPLRLSSFQFISEISVNAIIFQESRLP
jgi:hypothetical protein